MSIRKFYQVSVNLHRSVWEAFEHTPEFEKRFLAIVKGSEQSGSNSHDNELWANWNTLEKAQVCEKAFRDMGYTLAARLLK